jgi:hypothetical protein
MRLIEALLAILVVVGLTWAGWSLIAGALRSRAARWRVTPRSTAEGTAIYLEKPGQEPYLFRQLPRGASDEDVEDALIEAQVRADSFNAALRR